jgi:hypothetical protein
VSNDGEFNKVILLTKGELVGYEQRMSNMESIIKKFMLNKGVWMNENKVKQQIESIVPLE